MSEKETVEESLIRDYYQHKQIYQSTFLLKEWKLLKLVGLCIALE